MTITKSNQLYKLIIGIMLFISGITQKISAQENLVPNSSFEEYNSCPGISGYQINNCENWTSPTSFATPDYFNACSADYESNPDNLQYSVPENLYGHQHAHSGNAYAALVFSQYYPEVTAYSEYIQIELTSQLKAGHFYSVSFFVNNPNTKCCINSIGAVFLSSEMNMPTFEIIALDPQVVSDPALFFCDTAEWQEVRGTFQANGTEKFMIIGTFQKLPELKAINSQGNLIQQHLYNYTYIDDVSVMELSQIRETPTIFTPNGDGINDVLTFPESEFLSGKKITILNRWGSVIYEANSEDFSWDGKTPDGSECTDGTYFYRVSDVNISGFIELIR